MTSARDISGPGQTRAIRDVLQSLFVSELVAPSTPLWLFFAWITDIEVIDNTAREFAALCPDWPAAPIRLSAVIDALLTRGGQVNVLFRKDVHNDDFKTIIERLQRVHGTAVVRWYEGDNFHEKGMLGDDYLLTGSMNLTGRGLTVNDEIVTLRCDAETVAQRRIELGRKWSEQLR